MANKWQLVGKAFHPDRAIMVLTKYIKEGSFLLRELFVRLVLFFRLLSTLMSKF